MPAAAPPTNCQPSALFMDDARSGPHLLFLKLPYSFLATILFPWNHALHTSLVHIFFSNSYPTQLLDPFLEVLPYSILAPFVSS